MVFYKVTHKPRENLGLAHYAWLTMGQANGYTDPDELIDIFWDHNGQMILETVRSGDLKVLEEDTGT